MACAVRSAAIWDTASGGKRGAAALQKHRLDRSAAPLNRVLRSGARGSHRPQPARVRTSVPAGAGLHGRTIANIEFAIGNMAAAAERKIQYRVVQGNSVAVCCRVLGNDLRHGTMAQRYRGEASFLISSPMEAIRLVLPRRRWRWPVPSCRAPPDPSSCSRRMPTYLASAPRSS